MKGEVIKMSLDEIVARLRKVKYGDFVLADDHNDLVDAVRTISETLKSGSIQGISRAMKFGFYSSDTQDSLYNEGNPDYRGICRSLYSTKIGTIDCYYPILTYNIYMRGWISGGDNRSAIAIAFHTKDHPVGEVLRGRAWPFEYLDDHLYRADVRVYTTTPEINASGDITWMNWRSLSLPQDIYVVIWFVAYYYETPTAFTAYVDKIRAYWNLFGYWD
jgi:hypothetical protein